MGKESFRTLRMIESPMANTAPRGSDSEASTVKKIPRTITILGGFINNLEERKRKGRVKMSSSFPSFFLKPPN